MNRVLKALGLAALCLTVTGCPALIDSLNGSPQGLSASRGKGLSIDLGWSAPSMDSDDEREVTDYDVFRDGHFRETTSTSSYRDFDVDPAKRYRYTVMANFDDGSISGESSPASGWCVPGEALKLTSAPTGSRTRAGVHHSTDGWFRILVVEGWTYHFDSGSETTLSVCRWHSPWNAFELPEGNATSFTWKAESTGEVWLRTDNGTALRGWFE